MNVPLIIIVVIVVIAIVAVVVAVVERGRRVRMTSSRTESNGSDGSATAKESFGFGLSYSGIAAVTAILIPLGLWFGLRAGLNLSGGKAETMPIAPVMLTLVVLAGVIGLLAVLMMAALAFSAVKLADKNQALGLPEGSVRAVIALSLIVIFVISVVFLFEGLNPRPSQLEHLTLEQVNAIPGNVLISKQPEAIPAGAATPVQQLYTVQRYVESSKGAEDFAKQIITTISTLVVSISAFYFGSSTAISAQKSATASSTPPVITKQPADLSVSTGQPAEFTVEATGPNLSYQWQQIKDSGTTDIPGATANTYRIAKAADEHKGAKFSCKVSNPAGTVTSNVAELTVT